MRIVSDQLIAGYPAIEVRDFVRRYRFIEFFAQAAEESLALSPRAGAVFISKLTGLEFVKVTGLYESRGGYRLTSKG